MGCVVPFLVWSLGLETCGSPSHLVPSPQLWIIATFLGLMERLVEAVGLALGDEQLITPGSFPSHPFSFLSWACLNFGEAGVGVQGQEGEEERQVVVLLPAPPHQVLLRSDFAVLYLPWISAARILSNCNYPAWVCANWFSGAKLPPIRVLWVHSGK